jgi:hypothetical protein
MTIYSTPDILNETGQPDVRSATAQLSGLGVEIYKYDDTHIVMAANNVLTSMPIMEISGAGMFYVKHGVVTQGVILESTGFDVIQSTDNHIALKAKHKAEFTPVTNRPLVYR